MAKGNNLPFRPGDALASKRIASGRPSDSNIKAKYGRNPTGPMPPKDSESRNFQGKPYPNGMARTTDRVKSAARRRLGM